MKKKTRKNDNVNIYNLYINDVNKYGSIDEAKTQMYLKQYKEGDEKARKEAKEYIVGVHQRYVRSVANKFAHNDNLMDIISEGNIGLMMAIENYDMDTSVKFTTYAMYWIRKTIMAYITRVEPTVTPNNAIKLATYVPKIKQEFWNKNQRQPTIEEIQEILSTKHDLTFIHKADLLPYQPTSIDERYGEDEDGQEFMESSEYASKTATCNVEEFADADDKKIVVNQMLSTLSDRDALILKRLYGIDGDPKPLFEIAKEVGLTYERVRQIATNSVEKLAVTCKTLIDAC